MKKLPELFCFLILIGYLAIGIYLINNKKPTVETTWTNAFKHLTRSNNETRR